MCEGEISGESSLVSEVVKIRIAELSTKFRHILTRASLVKAKVNGHLNTVSPREIRTLSHQLTVCCLVNSKGKDP